MATMNECALFSANAYAASPDVVTTANAIPIPNGWTTLLPAGMSNNTGVNTTTGFLARAYSNGAGEIVVAYSGTTFEDGMKTFDWTNGNIPAAAGLSLAAQVVDAARFYLDVRQANLGAAITFTGHSLGGGLASLMAVYFNKAAYAFDEAPFERSADSATVVNALKRQLGADYSLADLAPEFLDYVPGTTNLARESLVQHTYVKGEVLRNLTAYFAAFGFGVGGPVGALVGLGLSAIASDIAAAPATEIDAGGSGVAATDLHSIVLLAALRQSQKFLDAAKTNPELLQQVFKSVLYVGNPQNKSEHNFLNLMLQQQVAGNHALDRLAEDVGKFTGALDPVASGVTGADAKLKSALYGLAIGLYYGVAENAIGTSNTPLSNIFRSLTGGIQFSPDPARKGEYEASLGTVLQELGLYFPDVKKYLTPGADRYTLPTTGALTAPEITDNLGDLMLGSSQGDNLAGGDGADTLLGRGGVDTLNGGAGNDILVGGIGNDMLSGGTGYDRYLYQLGDGEDRIDDSDGGVIEVFGSGGEYALGGIFVKQQGADTWSGQVSGHNVTVRQGSDWQIASDDGATFDLTTASDLNAFHIKLVDESAIQLPASYDRTIVGDLTPVDFDPNTPGIQTRTDDLGNVIVDPAQPQPGRADGLQDGAGNDDLQGKDGNDYLNAWRGGNDKLDGGAGDDTLLCGSGNDRGDGGTGNDDVEGGAGDDIVMGGDGQDMVFGGAGADKLYAGSEVGMADALVAQEAAGNGLKGDFLDAGTKDDTLVGDVGNDALMGGAGNDIILGGGGDDNIESDQAATQVVYDWSVQRSVTTEPDGSTMYQLSYTHVNFKSTIESGDDVVYAGAGNDWVFAGRGDDYVEGASGMITYQQSHRPRQASADMGLCQ